MNKTFLIILLSTLCCLTSCSVTPARARQVSSFNQGWKFSLSDDENARLPEFDDREWRSLNLPHDWAIEGEFSIDNPSGTGGGALPGGVGWYRKTFRVSSGDAPKKYFVDFDGVYMTSEVFVNGQLMGKRPYGYISFRYDMTPYLYTDRDNVIAVRVDNEEQPNSRWYSGCGIYRNVWLTEVNPLYVDQWGTYITTPEVSAEKALLSIRTTLKNEFPETAAIEVRSILKDKNGRSVEQTASNEEIGRASCRERVCQYV